MKVREEFEKICAAGESFGPVSGHDIDRAQEELGVIFPEEYRYFLEKYGALLARGIEIYGLAGESKSENTPPLWTNIVSATKELRQWGQAGTERYYLIPVSDDGTGYYFFMDTRSLYKSDIYEIGPGVDVNLSVGFMEFIVNVANNID